MYKLTKSPLTETPHFSALRISQLPSVTPLKNGAYKNKFQILLSR